jgi:hypothetical protein
LDIEREGFVRVEKCRREAKKNALRHENDKETKMGAAAGGGKGRA